MGKQRNTSKPSASLTASPRSEEGKPAQLTVAASEELSYFSPIPPPQILAGYNAIVAPDAADRILRMVERQEEHRQNLERKVIEGDTMRANWGLAAGTFVLIATLVASGYMVHEKQPIAGVSAFVAALTSLVGVFVLGTKSRKEERENRAKLMTGQTDAKDTSPAKATAKATPAAISSGKK